MSDAKTTRNQAEIQAEIDKLEAQRSALFNQRAPIDSQLMELRTKEKLLLDQMAEIVDPRASEGLEALWRIAWSNGIGHGKTKRRLEEYCRAVAPEIYTVMWHQAPDKQVYPVPQINLKRDQDVTALAAQLPGLLSDLAAGRSTVRVDIFEHTLSSDASFYIDFDLAHKKAALFSLHYGTQREILRGSLAEVLKRVAHDYWYE